MPISFQTHIGPLLDTSIAQLKQRFSDQESAQHIDTLSNAIRAKFDEVVFGTLEDGTICAMIEGYIRDRQEIPVQLREAIEYERLKMFAKILKQDLPGFQSLAASELVSGHTRGGESTENRRSEQPRKRGEIDQLAREYAVLAVFMGDAEAFDILRELGVLRENERGEALATISQFLGTCQYHEGDGILQELLRLPEAILSRPNVYAKMQSFLTRYCYKALMKDSTADTLDQQPETLQNIPKIIAEIIQSLYTSALGQQTTSVHHNDLCTDVVHLFKAAAELKIPDSMAKTVKDYHGTEWPLGSWRQRLAIATLMLPSVRRVYVDFDAGAGKTFTGFWAYMLQYEKTKKEAAALPRGLFLYPKAVMEEVLARVRPDLTRKKASSLYFPDQANMPSVGVIRAGMTYEEIQVAMKADMVFCSYTMWHQLKKSKDAKSSDPDDRGTPLYQLLAQTHPPFKFIQFDEAQLLQGDKTYTQAASYLMHHSSGLYENGHVLATSATPIPGEINGFRVTMELLERNRRPAQSGVHRRSNEVRAQAMRRLISGGKYLRYDRRELWQDEIELDLYDLTPQEMDALRAVIDDETLYSGEKLHLLQLMIRNPRLMNSDLSLPWTSLDRVKQQITAMFNENRSAILIAENNLSEVILRSEEEDAGMFFVALREWCTEQGVEFRTIHGETAEDDRIRIYEEVANTKQHGKKIVLLAQAKCLNLGIDLRSVDGIISLQWPFNSPDLYQLLRRMNRAGKKDGRCVVCCAKGTIEEGIMAAAKQKADDALLVLDGIAVSTDRMSALEESGDAARANDEQVSRFTHARKQEDQRIALLLQGVGTNGIRSFWERDVNKARFERMIDSRDQLAFFDDYRAIAALIAQMEKDRVLQEEGSYVDTQSFGSSVASFLASAKPDHARTVVSCDPTEHLSLYGSLSVPEHTSTLSQFKEASPDRLINGQKQPVIAERSQDLIILQGLHQMSHSVSTTDDVIMSGRVRALHEASKALQDGGIMIVPLPVESCTDDQFVKLREQLGVFGFDVDDTSLQSYNGKIVSQDNYEEPAHETRVLVARKVMDVSVNDIRQNINSSAMTFTALSESRLRRKSKYRKLPEELSHGEFKIGKKALNTIIKVKGVEEQLQYLERLKQAVKLIRTYATSVNEFYEKMQNDTFLRAELERHGIICLSQLLEPRSQRRKAQSSPHRRLPFRFKDSPHLFYPFDEQWKS
jgi:hypothetical protein